MGGTPYRTRSTTRNAFFRYDLGVVVLDEPMVMSTYGKLPALNAPTLAKRRGQQDVTFTAVGYGLQKLLLDASWKNQSLRLRMVARLHLLQINTGFTGDGSILLPNNAKTGGTCFGDSGGPTFIGTSNVVRDLKLGINGNWRRHRRVPRRPRGRPDLVGDVWAAISPSSMLL